MFNQIREYIEKYDTIIIHRHKNPDGDAVGSQVGLKNIIKDNYPDKRVFCVGDKAGRFGFVEGSDTDEILDGEYEGALGIMTITPSEGAIIGADIATKAANVEVIFVDRFNGSLVISGDVASVEAALKDVLDLLENVLKFAPTVITRT